MSVKDASVKVCLTPTNTARTSVQFEVTCPKCSATIEKKFVVCTEQRFVDGNEVKLRTALREAVDCYGKPGGPWNVPGDPGGWLSRAREALGDE